MSDLTKHSPDFVRVDDPSEFQKLLKEAVDESAPALIWTKNQEFLIRSKISVIIPSTRNLFTWIPPDFDARKFSPVMNERQDKSCFFNVSLSSACLFFSTQFLDCDNAGLRFETPGELFKIQRRGSFRFTIPMGHVMYLEFMHPLQEEGFKKKFIDLSATGLSFFCPDSEKELFQKDLTIQRATFKLGGKVFTIDFEVVHLHPSHPTGQKEAGFKVGARFVNIPQRDSDFISAWVFEESRKYFSKFI